MSRTTRRLLTKLLGRSAALALAGRLLFPSPALADPVPVFGGGLYLSFSFGEKVGIGYGIEGYGTLLLAGTESCGTPARAAVGPLLRLGTVNLELPRLSLSVAGGAELDDDARVALVGEGGVIYRFGSRSRLGFHVGVGPQMAFFHPFIHADVGLDEYAAGLAVRSSTLFGEPRSGRCVAGRVLRDARGAIVHAARLVSADPAVRAWADDAEEECTSILAFAELAEQLALADAPPSLIARAIAAGEEEIGHARGCAAMVERLTGQPFAPRAPHHARRTPIAGHGALARLAVESWTDGCLGEGAAAGWATAAAARAARTGTPGARLQHTIAEEESSHAALAWDVLAWAAQAGGDDVRHALWEARDTAPQLRDDEDDADARTARLDARARASILDAHVSASRARLAAVLAC